MTVPTKPFDSAEARAHAQKFRDRIARLKHEMQRVVVGQEHVVDGVLAALFADGHALLEGVPGLAKTLLVRTLAQTLSLSFSRIQFTPDLMPSDVLGTMVLHEKAGGGHELRFEQGPLVANIVLADEINRATPKTQSALLEAMQERTITVARETRPLPDPFIVLATQNPVEQEGTYPLPEAQVDRFLVKLLVTYPREADYHEILERTTGAKRPEVSVVMQREDLLEMRRLLREVPASEQVRTYAIRLVLATQPGSEYAPKAVNEFVALGSSPRGAQALLLLGKYKALVAGRHAVACEDVRASVKDVLRHRILLNFRAQAERKRPDDLLDAVLGSIPELSGR